MALYALATSWDTLADDKREPLRKVIREIVGYDCKIAAQSQEDCVHLFIWSINKRKITDWLEIQPSGALGVVFDEYKDPNAPAVSKVSDACDDYNDQQNLEFEDSDDDEESSSDEDEKEKDKEQTQSQTPITNPSPNPRTSQSADNP